MTMLNRPRGATSVLLAAVLLIAGCSSGVTATPSPSAPSGESPSEPPPSDAPTVPPPSPLPAPSFGEPEAADIPDSPRTSSMVTIVPGGDGFVAIGFNGAFGSLLWTSVDGRTWRDVTPSDFASMGIVNVVEFDGRLVGVGRGNTLDIEVEEAAVFLSDDGLAWRKVESSEQLVGQMIDVVATDDGLYAVGGVPGADAAGIWHSTDGETWERTGGDFAHAFMWAIAEGGPGLVAVGWRRNPEPDLAVWTSADGVDWTLAPDPEGFAGHEATDVVALPDGGLAMVGSPLVGGAGRMWFSTDGVDWTLAGAGDDGGFARTLAVLDDGLVALGGGEDMAARAWFSADGRSWMPIGDPLAEAFFQSATATETGLLVAGATQTGTLQTGIEAHAGIWHLPMGD